MEYDAYLTGKHWQRLRNERLELDGHACCVCGAQERIEVHHLFYRHDLNDTHLNDLITLCHECHNAVHRVKEQWFQSKMDKQERTKNGYLINYGGFCFEAARILTVACWRKGIFKTEDVRKYTERITETAIVKSGLNFYSPHFTAETLALLATVKDCLIANEAPGWNETRRKANADRYTRFKL